MGEKSKHLFNFGLGSGDAEGRDGWYMANEGEEMQEHSRGCRGSKDTFLLCYRRTIGCVTVPILSLFMTMGVILLCGIDTPHIQVPVSYGVRMWLSPRGFHLLAWVAELI